MNRCCLASGTSANSRTDRCGVRSWEHTARQSRYLCVTITISCGDQTFGSTGTRNTARVNSQEHKYVLLMSLVLLSTRRRFFVKTSPTRSPSYADCIIVWIGWRGMPVWRRTGFYFNDTKPKPRADTARRTVLWVRCSNSVRLVPTVWTSGQDGTKSMLVTSGLLRGGDTRVY